MNLANRELEKKRNTLETHSKNWIKPEGLVLSPSIDLPHISNRALWIQRFLRTIKYTRLQLNTPKKREIYQISIEVTTHSFDYLRVLKHFQGILIMLSIDSHGALKKIFFSSVVVFVIIAQPCHGGTREHARQSGRSQNIIIKHI